MPEAEMSPDWTAKENDAEMLAKKVIQLANDTERRGLPFVATALRNLTSMIDAEYRVMQSLCHRV